MTESVQGAAINDQIADQIVIGLPEHSQPAAHDADNDQDHSGAKYDGDERNPGDSPLHEIADHELGDDSRAGDDAPEGEDGGDRGEGDDCPEDDLGGGHLL